MRLLLSFILLSSFFFAPLKSNAGGVTVTRVAKLTEDKIAKKAIIHYLVSDDHTAVISNLDQRNRSANRYRSFSPVDFFTVDCLIKKTIPPAEIKYFVAPYSYCKSIGLKLIFPKHYFW